MRTIGDKHSRNNEEISALEKEFPNRSICLIFWTKRIEELEYTYFSPLFHFYTL